MSTRSVFCIVPSRGRADRIIDALKRAEFSRAAISVLFLDRGAAVEKSPANNLSVHVGPVSAESAGEIRGTMAWISGIRPLVIPGAAPLIVAGPIANTLDEVTVGGIAGGLIAFGVPRDEAGRYETRIEGGHIFISVHGENPEACDQARDIFTVSGADEIFTIVEVTKSKGPLSDGRPTSRVAIA